MITYLPFDDYTRSANCLDDRILGRQRVDCKQILNALRVANAWSNHPGVRMWRGYEYALVHYYGDIVQEWCVRGYAHNMALDPRHMAWAYKQPKVFPWWLSSNAIHVSHKVQLSRKGDYVWDHPLPPYMSLVWPVNRDGSPNKRVKSDLEVASSIPF